MNMEMDTACFFCIIALVSLSLSVSAQEVVISGRIETVGGNPVEGANVFIKGTVYGASTQSDGTFSFRSAPLGDTILSVRHVGMEPKETRVLVAAGFQPAVIRLTPRANLLREAAVTKRNHRSIDNNRSISLTTMDVDTSPGSDGDVTSALRQLPGVQTVGENGALFVRGGSGDESKTFIDGLEITYPYFAGIPDIAQRSRYSPHLFEGITFSTGGYTAAYGDALSSILSLDSRNHPDKNSTVLALLPYGVQFGHDRLFREDRSAGMDIAYSNFGPYYRLIHHRTDWTDAPENWMANANFRHTVSGGGMFKWYGYGNLSSQAASLPDVNAGGRLMATAVGNRNAVSLLTFERPLVQGGNLYLGYGFNYNRDRYDVQAESRITAHAQHQLRIALKTPIGANASIDWGAEGYVVRYAASAADTLINRRGGAWAEFSFSPLVGATIRPGIRLDYSNLMANLSATPRITIAYQLSAANRLSFVAGRYAQQPDYQYIQGTDRLHYPYADHYLANFQHYRAGRLLRVEAYRKTYRRLVSTLGERNNEGEGMTHGVDVFWRDQGAIEGLDYWLSYSYLRAKRKYLDYPVQAMPSFATPHTLHLVAKQFIRPLGVFVGGSYGFATGRPYFNPDNPTFLGDRTPAYHNLNINAALLRKWGNTFVTFVAAVNNVGGTRQVFGYRYAADGGFRLPVENPYGRALLVAAFISFGKDRSEEILNQLP